MANYLIFIIHLRIDIRGRPCGDVRFIGVDLGWRMDPPREEGTGFCQLDDGGKVEVARTITSDQDILDAVAKAGDAWVAIDASLKVPNETGLRSCERALRDLGIRVLPTNRRFLARFGGSRGEVLVDKLSDLGYRTAEKGGERGRLIFEAFPHGTLHLLSGGRRPDYKKGARPHRAEGRSQVVELITGWEPALEAPSSLLAGSPDKALEDILDAWVCAACIYSHWLNHGLTTLMVGDMDDGRILLGCQRHG